MATDGIAIIVNTGCTLDNVTPDEVYGLYAEGAAIGTVNAAISRESGSGTRGAFDELVKNSEGKTLDKAESFAKCVQTQNSTGAVITQISTAGNTNLIGYISWALSEKVKALKYNGVEATVANIESGAYKLSRPFLLLSKEGKTLSEAAQKFHDFIFSAEGQAIVEKDGYIKAVK
ncbi:MAG: substrate-binding domain-containing protein [Christensenellaceae bacterium]